MSEQVYDGLMETVHLLNSPANAARLLRSTEADRKYNAAAVGNHDLVYESYFRS
jgi:antitoxin YefM